MAIPKRKARATPMSAAMDTSPEAGPTQPEARATPSRTRGRLGQGLSHQSNVQHRARRPRFTEDQVAEALEAAGGVLAGAARYLADKYRRPCSRPTVHNYVKMSVRLQRIIGEIDESRGDFAEALLWRHIEAGSERSLHFYMSTKMKHRGYARGVEVAGKNGGPIQTQPQPIDLSNLSDTELEALARLVDKAGTGLPAPNGAARH